MLMKSKKNVLPPRTSDVELETTTSWIHKVLKEMATTTLHLVKSVIDDYYPRLYLKIRLPNSRVCFDLVFGRRVIFMGKLKSCQQSFYLSNSFRSRSKQMQWEQKDKNLNSKPRYFQGLIKDRKGLIFV